MYQEPRLEIWIRRMAVALGLCCLPAVGWSQVPLGPRFRVNNYTTGEQTAEAVAADAAGGFVAVWNSADADARGLFARVHDAAGTPLGSDEFRVNGHTPGNQYAASVVLSPDGTFVVAWHSPHDGHNGGVFGRRFDAGGLPGPELRLNSYTTDIQYAPAISMDADGDFVVVWTSQGGQDGSFWGVFGQRFDAAFVPVGPEFRVNTATLYNQHQAGVAMAADGRFVVVWANTGLINDVQGQRYDGTGLLLGGEFTANSYPIGGQYEPAVASDADGNFVVVWTSNIQDGSNEGVFGQRYAADGTPRGAEFRVNANTNGRQLRPAVAMDPRGNFVVVWTSYLGQLSVYGRRFDAAGRPEGPDFRLSEVTTTTLQRSPRVSAAANGDFVTLWTETTGSSTDVFAQRFRPDVVFKDDFESAGLGAWSASATDGGDLGPSIFAAMKGSTVGLRGVVDDTAGIYVQDESPDDQRQYFARFYFDPNGFDPGEAAGRLRTRVFIAFSEAPMRRVAAIVLRRQGGLYSIRARVRLDDNSQFDTPFVPIDDAPHALELQMRAASAPEANDGRFFLSIDGSLVAGGISLDTSLGAVDFVRLGALSVKPGASGTMYWDEFESRRQNPIGP